MLYRDLKIESLDQLEAAAREGKVRDLAGFGEKTEQNILQSIQVKADTGQRFLRAGMPALCGSAREVPEETARASGK